ARAHNFRSSWSPTLVASDQEVAEHERAVVLRVVSRVEECHRTVVRRLEDRAPRVRVRGELGAIPPLELLPPLDSVAEPRAQLGARRPVLEPRVGGDRLLLPAARPQALDEQTAAVGRGGRLVRALDSNLRCHSTTNLRTGPASATAGRARRARLDVG